MKLNVRLHSCCLFWFCFLKVWNLFMEHSISCLLSILLWNNLKILQLWGENEKDTWAGLNPRCFKITTPLIYCTYWAQIKMSFLFLLQIYSWTPTALNSSKDLMPVNSVSGGCQRWHSERVRDTAAVFAGDGGQPAGLVIKAQTWRYPQLQTKHLQMQHFSQRRIPRI